MCSIERSMMWSLIPALLSIYEFARQYITCLVILHSFACTIRSVVKPVLLFGGERLDSFVACRRASTDGLTRPISNPDVTDKPKASPKYLRTIDSRANLYDISCHTHLNRSICATLVSKRYFDTSSVAGNHYGSL